VPVSRFADLVDYVGELNARSPLRINTFGHAGDGNLHVGFLSMTGDERDMELIEVEVEQVLRKSIELGGTLSAEHGIGIAKRNYLHLEFDEATLGVMKSLKSLFDPQNLLNPGKIFPLDAS